MHATCTTQDIGSWWYLKSRLLCGDCQRLFFARKPRIAYLRDYRTELPIIAHPRFDTPVGALLEIAVPKV